MAFIFILMLLGNVFSLLLLMIKLIFWQIRTFGPLKCPLRTIFLLQFWLGLLLQSSVAILILERCLGIDAIAFLISFWCIGFLNLFIIL